MKKEILTILIFGILITPAFGGEYYVDPLGNDKSSGTIDAPFKTIQRGVDAASLPGDIVWIKDGVYPQGFIAERFSGTKDQPIIIKAINTQQVLIDPSKEVLEWSNEGLPKNFYQSAAFSDSRDILWKEGLTSMLVKKNSMDLLKNADEYYFDKRKGRFVIYSENHPHKSIYKIAGDLGIIIRGVSFVEVDGLVVQYARVPVLVGVASPTLGGPATAHITIQNSVAQYADFWGMAATTSRLQKSDHIVFDRVTVRYVDEFLEGENGHCIKFAANHNDDGGTYATVSNSTVYDCTGAGIQFSNGWAFGEFFNNRIYNYGLRGSGTGSGVRCGSSGSDLAGCSIYNNDIGGGAAGKDLSIGTSVYIQEDANHVRVFNNKLHDNAWHGVYVFAVGEKFPYDIQIYNNLIYNNQTTGIRIQQSQSVEVLNNSFYNNAEEFPQMGAALNLFSSDALGVEFFNNAIFSVFAPALRVNADVSYEGDYNLFYTKTDKANLVIGEDALPLFDFAKATGQEQNSLWADPRFRDPDQVDFLLKPTSPAIDSGLSLEKKFNTDYAQTPRLKKWDIGAYEQIF